MGYLMTNRAGQDGLFVAESLRTYKDVVQENLVPIWKAKRPGEEPPRFDQMLEFMADATAVPSLLECQQARVCNTRLVALLEKRPLVAERREGFQGRNQHMGFALELLSLPADRLTTHDR